MRAIVISIGNELTLGQTVDTNSAWLSQRLAEIGVRVRSHVTIDDELEPIRSAIERASAEADVVLISGGLGPTEDDLTRQALAAAMGVELQCDDERVAEIRSYFSRRDLPMPETNLIQAHVPAGATAIRNTCGTAPGLRAELNHATVFVLPGVPREMKEMYRLDVQPELRTRSGDAIILARTILAYGAGESAVNERIRDLMSRAGNPTVGTTARQTIIGVRIHAFGENPDDAKVLLDATSREVRDRLGPLVFGEDEDTLGSAVVRLLIDRKMTVATAESCTGGLIAKSLTDVPGSSACFVQGFVTYANESKTQRLEVPESLITRHGAVSPQVAEVMAVQCRRISHTDFAVSTTGIAGPTGGSSGKPVGLVYIGLADAAGGVVHEHRIGDFLTRAEIRDRAGKAALDHLRLRLLTP